MKTMLAFGLVIIFTASTVFSQPVSTPYVKEIEAWQKRRETSLKADNGWLNLVGLYWLQPGENSFGSDKKNRIVFPAGTIAPQAGILDLKDNAVSLTVNQADVRINGQPVKTALVFHPDSLHNPMMAAGSLRWTIIRRQDQIGIRLRDLASKNVVNFKGIEYYPVDSNWRITATLHKPAMPVQIMIANVMGQSSLQPSPGKLMFTINGEPYALDALEEDGELFIIFADETSGRETYGSGRFMRAAMPGDDGITILDFNKAYNPPCAFTPYATCPLPPSQNVLPVAITAGEKDYHVPVEH